MNMEKSVDYKVFNDGQFIGSTFGIDSASVLCDKYGTHVMRYDQKEGKDIIVYKK